MPAKDAASALRTSPVFSALPERLVIADLPTLRAVAEGKRA